MRRIVDTAAVAILVFVAVADAKAAPTEQSGQQGCTWICTPVCPTTEQQKEMCKAWGPKCISFYACAPLTNQHCAGNFETTCAPDPTL